MPKFHFQRTYLIYYLLFLCEAQEILSELCWLGNLEFHCMVHDALLYILDTSLVFWHNPPTLPYMVPCNTNAGMVGALESCIGQGKCNKSKVDQIDPFCHCSKPKTLLHKLENKLFVISLYSCQSFRHKLLLEKNKRINNQNSEKLNILGKSSFNINPWVQIFLKSFQYSFVT